MTLTDAGSPRWMELPAGHDLKEGNSFLHSSRFVVFTALVEVSIEGDPRTDILTCIVVSNSVAA